MDKGAPWKPAPENTLESLRHAFSMFDGVEFDIRLTADGQLIVHHDRTVSVPEEHLKGHPKWMEEWDLDDLTGLGFRASMLSSMTPPCSRLGVMKGQWDASRSNAPTPRAPLAEGFSVERTTTNTSPRSCVWQTRSSTNAAFHVKTRCTTPFIEACPLQLASQQPSVLGRHSSLTSRPTATAHRNACRSCQNS